MQQTLEKARQLLSLMSSNVNYNLDDLAKRTGVSKRTIQRYLSSFREAGIEVSSGKDGRHVSYPEETVHDNDGSIFLSDDEAKALLKILNSSDEESEIKKTLLKKISALQEKKL